MNPNLYIWHELKLRGKCNRVIASSCTEVGDDLVRERCKIAAQYHPNQIECLTTHTRIVEESEESR